MLSHAVCVCGTYGVCAWWQDQVVRVWDIRNHALLEEFDMSAAAVNSDHQPPVASASIKLFKCMGALVAVAMEGKL